MKIELNIKNIKDMETLGKRKIEKYQKDREVIII